VGVAQLREILKSPCRRQQLELDPGTPEDLAIAWSDLCVCTPLWAGRHDDRTRRQAGQEQERAQARENNDRNDNPNATDAQVVSSFPRAEWRGTRILDGLVLRGCDY